MNIPPPDIAPIDQKNAEIYMRMFVLSLNNVTVYGANHPSAAKAVQDFFVHAGKILAGVPLITLMLDRDSFYIEQWRVDKGLNVGKIVGQFKKLGLQSITIERGVGRDHLRDFLNIMADNRTFPTVDAIKQELASRAISAIRLNYVVYQKVTTDEAVISRDAVSGPGGGGYPVSGPPPNAKQAVLSELSKVFSLRDLMEKPEQVAGAVLGAAGSDNAAQRNAIVAQIRSLTSQLTDPSKDNVDVQKVMEAVYALKMELQNGLAVQRQLGRIVSATDPVLDEVDAMTCDVIVKMVREEFQSGAISTKRLGVIIRRMIPDTKDLQRFLPRLKQGLLSDGMNAAQFLDLVQELFKEIQSDGIMEVLEQGAEALGLSADEIVANIKENPVEAARLIVLATEIRQNGSADGADLSGLLSDYVERIGSKQVAVSGEPEANRGGKALAEMLHRIEVELVERFRGQGIPDDVLKQVEQRLSDRFQQTLKQLKSSWLINCLSAGKEVTDAYIINLLEGVVEQESDLAGLKDPLSEALLARGHTASEVQRLYEQVAARVSKKTASGVLPKGVLTINNTLFFLKHQAGLAVRYNNPFSGLVVSVPILVENGVRRPPTAEEAPIIIAEIFGVGVRLLRDLDLFGSLGSVENNRPFILLPMTPHEGALVVRQRLVEKLNRLMVMLREGVLIQPIVIVSAHSFDREKFKELKPFLEYVKVVHAKEEKIALAVQ